MELSPQPWSSTQLNSGVTVSRLSLLCDTRGRNRNKTQKKMGKIKTPHPLPPKKDVSRQTVEILGWGGSFSAPVVTLQTSVWLKRLLGSNIFPDDWTLNTSQTGSQTPLPVSLCSACEYVTRSAKDTFQRAAVASASTPALNIRLWKNTCYFKNEMQIQSLFLGEIWQRFWKYIVRLYVWCHELHMLHIWS